MKKTRAKVRQMSRRVRMFLTFIAVAAVATACSSVNTQPDQVALHYNAGTFSDTKFADCDGVSTHKVYDGVGDKHYVYPNGQRTFEFSGDQQADAKPIAIVSQDNVELTAVGGLTFNLDTSCTPVTINGKRYAGGMLQAFHENIGLKFTAYTGEGADPLPGKDTSQGWENMLQFYMGQSLKNAMSQAAQKYGWLALWNDPATREKFDQEVKDNLAGAIKNTTGGVDYFKNFNLTLQKPTPPQGLVDAYAAAQQAIAQKQTVLDQNATVAAEMDQINKLTSALGPYGYILYKALNDCEQGKLKNGCPSFLPVPQGANINIVPGGVPAGK